MKNIDVSINDCYDGILPTTMPSEGTVKDCRVDSSALTRSRAFCDSRRPVRLA